MAKPIVMSWQLVTRAPIEQAWRELSDTDRFNGVAEAGFTFVRGEPGSAPQGSIKKLGLTVAWTEEPFRYRAPRWFRVERVFQSGPAERLIARAELTATPERGTQIDYRVEVHPRGFFSSAILGVDLGRSSRPKIERALRDLVAALDQDAVFETYGGAPPPLGREAELLVSNALRALPASPLLDRLVAFLRVGPEREQSRISAPALADAWHAQLDQVVEVLLRATEAGLLSVTLDLLCPACQVPRGTLVEGVMEVHCEACGIRYDATFPELIAVHFRPAIELRDLHVKIECIGSPGQSRHIVAQDVVPPGAEVDLLTELQPGMYRLRTLPAIGTPALIEVTHGSGARDASFRCGAIIHPQMVRLATPKSLLVRNETSVPLTTILERVERPRQIMTAGRMLAEFPRFKSFAPVLPFFSKLELYRAGVLSIACVETPVATVLDKLVRAKLTYSSDGTVFAVYADHGDLLDDATAVGLVDGDEALRSYGGATTGMVFDHVRAGKTIPMGTAVDEAFAAMQGAGFGRLTVPARLASDPLFAAALAARQIAADPHGYPASDGQPLVELRR